MPKEIERKFLPRDDSWRPLASAGVRYRQGYLCRSEGRTVRVRLAGAEGYVTIKGPTRGASRDEYEYAIPAADAAAMLDELCEKPLIEKTRYEVNAGGLTWEIDEFEGENGGLVVAEVELPREDHPVELPPWAGREVTGEAKYYNANLVASPYSRW